MSIFMIRHHTIGFVLSYTIINMVLPSNGGSARSMGECEIIIDGVGSESLYMMFYFGDIVTY